MIASLYKTVCKRKRSTTRRWTQNGISVNNIPYHISYKLIMYYCRNPWPCLRPLQSSATSYNYNVVIYKINPSVAQYINFRIYTIAQFGRILYYSKLFYKACMLLAAMCLMLSSKLGRLKRMMLLFLGFRLVKIWEVVMKLANFCCRLRRSSKHNIRKVCFKS